MEVEGEVYVNGDLAGDLKWNGEEGYFVVYPRRGDHVRIVARSAGFPEVEGEVPVAGTSPGDRGRYVLQQ